MLRRRMGYADPSSGKDILGNRSLCFIFICAFGLVTLLQQILYGKNYIKNAQQFSRLKGDETGNWTGPVNFSDDRPLKPARNGRKRCFRQNIQPDSKISVVVTPCVAGIKKKKKRSQRYLDNYDGSFEYNSTACRELRQEIMDVKVLSMVKTSDLFERWRNLQVCKWEQNKEEASNFKMSLSRCCNAPSFLFTTKRNTPSGTKLRYEVDTSGILPITTEVFKMFPDDMPYSKSQYKKCAVIGNGGIIKNSKCGKEIDSADFVFRCNIPPIIEKYSADVGTKTDLVTINPSIITERYCRYESEWGFRSLSHSVCVCVCLCRLLLWFWSIHIMPSLQISEAGEMATTVLRSPPELRELLGGASSLLQHPQHRRLFQGQIHAGRLRPAARRVFLPPAVLAQRAALLGGAGRPGQEAEQRPDARDRRLGDVRGGSPLRLLGVPHEPLRHLHHPPLLRQRQAAAGLPRHASRNFQLHPHAYSRDPPRAHGAVHVIPHSPAPTVEAPLISFLFDLSRFMSVNGTLHHFSPCLKRESTTH
ncbi:alpha-2,8-sialyltransferase 8E isoform X2 [Platichthys flesus]|uniref:alpha-2,8-sialyltransferase 8E isoform X2 n=1 Tax=Platichthys flesus TaxID=8260 RepID=UPI002DB6D2FF|nr:alpha-2,8-sialyltransferase 8E isoform X2 [Platichthys flesus]